MIEHTQNNNQRSKKELNASSFMSSRWKIFIATLLIIVISPLLYYFFNKEKDIAIVFFVVINFILCCIIANLAPSYYHGLDENKHQKKQYNNH